MSVVRPRAHAGEHHGAGELVEPSGGQPHGQDYQAEVGDLQEDALA